MKQSEVEKLIEEKDGVYISPLNKPIEVELLNTESEEDMLRAWGEFSRICYNTPKEKAIAVAKHCYKSGHFSGSRTLFFKFHISNVSRATVDQLIRHEIGVVAPVKNVKSQRYCDEKNFSYYIPPKIEQDAELLRIYIESMEFARNNYYKIQKALKDSGFKNEVANENARGVLPMNTHSEVCIGFTPEALLHFMNVRLCMRSQDEIRQLAVQMKIAIAQKYPFIIKDCVPQCQKLMYCPENNSKKCPMGTNVLSESELQQAINLYKEIKQVK